MEIQDHQEGNQESRTQLEKKTNSTKLYYSLQQLSLTTILQRLKRNQQHYTNSKHNTHKLATLRTNSLQRTAKNNNKTNRKNAANLLYNSTAKSKLNKKTNPKPIQQTTILKGKPN